MFFFSKYDREVVRVFQIREHHAKIVKFGRYDFNHLTLSSVFHLTNTFLSWLVHWHLSFKVLVSENSLDVNYTTVSSYPYMYII